MGDLHLGKRVNEFSMLEDQTYMLAHVLRLAQEHSADALLIAGDVYDRTTPAPEAVELLDRFLTQACALHLKCFIISGNHDSPERLAFGSRLMEQSGIYISPVYRGSLTPIRLEDKYGPVYIWLLPFLRPAHVRRYHPEAEPGNYEQAVGTVLDHARIDRSARNILVAHQFVTYRGQAPEQCESETVSIGTLDNVDTSVFDAFDYVALGHIHKPQHVGRDTVRYSGSLLKYSFSEAGHRKSAPLIKLGGKGQISVNMLPLVPLRDMRELRGPIDRLMQAALGEQTDQNKQDYLHVTLTDNAVMDAMAKLRTVYPNVMRLDFDNPFTAQTAADHSMVKPAGNTPLALFETFYEQQNNAPMDQDMQALAASLLMELEGETL